MPRVTACISCYNHQELLKGTLESILAQSFEDWECIVVDDGSVPPVSIDEFKDPRIRLHRFDENQGIPHGANWAYQHAQGEFIQTLGCDERIAPSKFADQVAYLDAHPDIDCLWGVPGNGPMGPVSQWEQYWYRAHNRSKELWLKCLLLLEGVPIGGASALWRKKVFDSIGYFDPKLTAFSDHEWFCRFFESHQGRVLPYRWMNEVPGYKTVCTRTPANAEKLDAELKYVREKHSLIVQRNDGLITLAMPVFNHAKFIAEAIRGALAQTDANFELLIMDDGSTEDIESEVKQFLTDPRIRFFKSEKNEGMMRKANKLLAMAKGDFFVIFSADDTSDPKLLEKLRAGFYLDPFAEMVASQNDFITEDGKPFDADHPFKLIEKARNRSVDEWMDHLRLGNVYFGIGMYRTATLRELGGWNPECGVISDYEMYLRLILRHNILVIEEPLTHTRIHGKNQSILNKEESGKLKRRYFDAQKPYYKPRPKVIIATPFYELKGFSPYITSMLATTRMLSMHNIEWEFMDLSGDSYVHRARNSICMDFLQDPWATDLFFIDSDMAWEPQAFIHMVCRPEPVIGGTYPVKNKWELWTSKPILFDKETEPHYRGIPLPDGSSLIEAAQLAGGFLRLKRSVLEKYIERYPTYYTDTHPDPEKRKNQIEFFTAGLDRSPEVRLLAEIEKRMNENGDTIDLSDLKDRFEKLKGAREFVGEDYSFSNRLREMGVQIFIYPKATISHFGVHRWDGNFHEHLRQLQEEQKPQKAT